MGLDLFNMLIPKKYFIKVRFEGGGNVLESIRPVENIEELPHNLVEGIASLLLSQQPSLAETLVNVSSPPVVLLFGYEIMPISCTVYFPSTDKLYLAPLIDLPFRLAAKGWEGLRNVVWIDVEGSEMYFVPPDIYDLLVKICRSLAKREPEHASAILPARLKSNLAPDVIPLKIRIRRTGNILTAENETGAIRFARSRELPFDLYRINLRSTNIISLPSPSQCLALPALLLATLMSLEDAVLHIMKFLGEEATVRNVPNNLLNALLRGEVPEELIGRVLRTTYPEGANPCIILISIPEELTNKLFPSQLLEELKQVENMIYTGSPTYLENVEGRGEIDTLKIAHERTRELTSRTVKEELIRKAEESGLKHEKTVKDFGKFHFSTMDIFWRELGRGRTYSTYLTTGIINHIFGIILGNEGQIRISPRLVIKPSIAILPSQMDIIDLSLLQNL